MAGGQRRALATVAAIAVLVAGAFATAAAAGNVGTAAAIRHDGRRVTLAVYVAGGMSPGVFHKIAATVVLRGPAGKTRRIKVPAHPLLVSLPTGRYHSYALYPRAVGFVLKCYAKGGTFLARNGLSLKYICNVP